MFICNWIYLKLMNMRTRLFGMMALLASIFAMTACQKDKADDTWKQLPVDQITVESGNAELSVNEIPCTYGNVQLVAGGEDNAVLTLTDVVPGYSEVKVNVDLLKKSDDSFAFKGTTIVSTPPSIAATLRSTDDNPCYSVNVEGSITLDGAVKVTVATQVQGDAAPLFGSWNIVRKCKYIEGKGVDPNDRSPIQPKWKISDGVGEKLLKYVSMFNHFGNCVLTEVFDQVTFDETGNIMARYWPDFGEDDSLKGLLSLIGPPSNGYYIYKPKYHTDWLESPKANFAFWYAKGNSLYVVPNVTAIIDVAKSENLRSDASSGIDISEIKEFLENLKEYGVDVNALSTEIQKILQRGVELKYSLEGDNLKIYVDKALCSPIVEAILPALPKLDVLLDQLTKGDNDTAGKIKVIMIILGLDKLTETIWNATTELEISLNFTKA